MNHDPRRKVQMTGVAAVFMLATLAVYLATPLAGATASPHNSSPAALYRMDCNGDSPVQHNSRYFNCSDILGINGIDNANTWGGKFYDNGVYIGHDEPDATFLSTAKGSGDNVTWGYTLGKDPAAAPTDAHPGKDVSHWFQLTPAPWLSMALCDGDSYPQLPCTPESDANAPAPCKTNAAQCSQNVYPGGGSAFMEMQFYPPGNAPFYDNESCDGTHWCAALTIDSLECTAGYAVCNNNCEEPVNFSFIQTDGVPTPQGGVPDSKTLLMNPGDKLSVHMADAPVPGGGGAEALKVTIDDLTTHQSGFMQASAKNGFTQTSIADCSRSPFNFQPEYSSASTNNYIPWAALRTNISTEFETGHWESCTSLSNPLSANPFDPSDPDGTYSECHGPYETAGGAEGPESNDAICYQAGDTHPGYLGAGTSTAPDQATGCQDNVYQNGDLDFDGSPYWTEWPTSTTPGTYPGSFVESFPTTNGKEYSQYLFQTDVALSESVCQANDTAKCTVPPAGPGRFYPFWSKIAAKNGTCTLEFGNVTKGTGLSDFNKDGQYGKVQFAKLGYPEFIGNTITNKCKA